MFVAAFAGRDATHDFRAVGDRLLGVKCTFPSGEALKKNFCLLVDEYAHCASLTTFSAASFMPSATVKFNPDSLRSLLSEFHVGAFHPDHDGDLNLQFPRGGNHAIGKRVAAKNTPEYVD